MTNTSSEILLVTEILYNRSYAIPEGGLYEQG